MTIHFFAEKKKSISKYKFFKKKHVLMLCCSFKVYLKTFNQYKSKIGTYVLFTNF